MWRRRGGESAGTRAGEGAPSETGGGEARRMGGGGPDVREQGQGRGGEVGGVHVQRGQVGLQEGGRGGLGLRGGGLLTDTQDPARTHTHTKGRVSLLGSLDQTLGMEGL